MKDRIGSLSNDDIKMIHAEYQKHISDGEIRENLGIIAVLDVLGWKDNIQPNDVTVYFSLINKLRSTLLDICLRCADKDEPPNVRISTLSDTIVILVDRNTPYHQANNIFGHISKFITDALQHGIMFRGAMSWGKYYTSHLDNSFVGKPFYDAAEIAEKVDWAGVIITDSLATELLRENKLEDLKNSIGVIQYNDIPFKKGFTTQHKLVLLPERPVIYKEPDWKKEYFDFISAYKPLMAGQEQKLKNTQAFFEYLNETIWLDEK